PSHAARSRRRCCVSNDSVPGVERSEPDRSVCSPNRPQQEALLREPNDVQQPRPGGSPACCASRLDPSHPTTSRKGQQPSSKCQNGSPDRSLCSPNRPQQEAQYARAIPVKTIPSG